MKHYSPAKRYSVATIHSNTAYLCGHFGTDLSKDIKGQTEDTLAQLDKTLAELGTAKSKLLSVLIHIKTMDDFEGLNEIYDQWAPVLPPARTCVVGEMFSPECLVEITVTVAL